MKSPKGQTEGPLAWRLSAGLSPRPRCLRVFLSCLNVKIFHLPLVLTHTERESSVSFQLTHNILCLFSPLRRRKKRERDREGIPFEFPQPLGFPLRWLTRPFRFFLCFFALIFSLFPALICPSYLVLSPLLFYSFPFCHLP